MQSIKVSGIRPIRAGGEPETKRASKPTLYKHSVSCGIVLDSFCPVWPVLLSALRRRLLFLFLSHEMYFFFRASGAAS